MSADLGPRAARAARRVADSRAAASLVGVADRVLARVDPHSPDILAVLTYHRVGPTEVDDLSAPTMVTADTDTFRAQMDLVRDIANPVSLADVLDAVDGDRALPPRAVLVTFDDAYRDFPDHAWPILLEREIPTAMFVPTAFPGDPTRIFWWDALWSAVERGDVPSSVRLDSRDEPLMVQFRELRDRVLAATEDEARSLLAQIVGSEDLPTPSRPMPRGPVSDWDTLRDLSAQGLAIAAHTHTHAALHRLPPDDARAEIERSTQELRQQRLGDFADVLAYPGGGHDASVRAAAADAGIRLAMTTERGVNRADRIDRFRVRRINIGRATSPALLRGQLLPSLGRIRRWVGDSE